MKRVREKFDDNWRTPIYLFSFLDNIFDFKLDPCASATIEGQKMLPIPYKLTEDDDGLNQDWHNSSTFINPPESKIMDWVLRVTKEVERRIKIIGYDNMKPIVMLLPSTPHKDWFFILNKYYVHFIFFPHPITLDNGKRKNCMIAYFANASTRRKMIGMIGSSSLYVNQVSGHVINI